MQRTVNFVRHLPASGWMPVVLSACARVYEKVNTSAEPLLENESAIHTFALDAKQDLSLLGRYPGIFALPDRWSTWWLSAVREGKRQIRKGEIRVIWSTYPIATAHMIAASLAQWSKLPWVADFRDPIFTSDETYTCRLQRRARDWVERRTVRLATKCIVTTESMANLYKERYPESADKFIVIRNGFDSQTFSHVRPNRYGASSGKLLLLHSGQLYPHERDPSALFAAVRKLIDQGVLPEDKVLLRFRGSGHDALLETLAKKFGVEKLLELAEMIPYQDAVSEVMAADILLLLQGRNFNPQVPAKTYEYLRSGRQVLALIDSEGDTARLLRDFASPQCADIDDVAEISARLASIIANRDTPTITRLLAADQEAVRIYSREAQTGELAKLLTAVCSSRV